MFCTTVADFHKFIQNTYSSGKELDVTPTPKQRGEWKYSCQGCDFLIIGHMSRPKNGPKKFSWNAVKPGHTYCNFQTMESYHLACTSVSAAPSSEVNGRPITNWSLPQNRVVLETAMERVQKGEGQRQVAKQLGLSQSVLSKSINGKRTLEAQPGRAQTIPADLEAIVASHCLTLSEHGWGVGRKELKLIAQEVVQIHGLGLDFKASNSWCQNFMSRHPECSTRRGQSFDGLRAAGLNPKTCTKFFKLLEEVVRTVTHNGGNLDPDFWINLDETATAQSKNGKKVIAKFGAKAVHVLSYEKSVSGRITCVNMIGAGEKIFQPHYIFEGKDKKKIPVDAMNEDGSLKCLDPDTKV